MKEFDVLIVGNGVLALSSAFQLAIKDKNIKVGLIGKKERLGSATAAAGAMLNSFAELEENSLDHPISRQKFEWNREAFFLWRSWADKINSILNEDALKLGFGTYIIKNASSDSLDDANFKAIKNYLAEFKEPFEEVAPTSIEGYSPSPESRALGAIYLPQEGFVSSFELLSALENCLKKFPNVEIIDEDAVSVEVKGKLKSIATSNGKTLNSQKIVICAGAQSQKFIDQIGLSKKVPRLFFGVGTSLILKLKGEMPKKVIRTVNRGLACGLHLVPRDNKTVFVGATNNITPWPEYSSKATSLLGLLKSSIEQLNTQFYKAQVDKVNIGHRPTSADTFPLVGKTSVEGVWILTGTKREGIHVSPLYSQWIADEIVNEKTIAPIAFRPERELIHTCTRDEGIDKAVKHLLSAAYQHELHLPKLGWEDKIRDFLRADVETLYDKLGIKSFGIQPELLEMYRYGHIEVKETIDLKIKKKAA